METILFFHFKSSFDFFFILKVINFYALSWIYYLFFYLYLFSFLTIYDITFSFSYY